MGLVTLLPRVYLDAGIYGTDEEDVGKDDEDTDVDPQHDRGAAGDEGMNNLTVFPLHSQMISSLRQTRIKENASI